MTLIKIKLNLAEYISSEISNIEWNLSVFGSSNTLQKEMPFFKFLHEQFHKKINNNFKYIRIIYVDIKYSKNMCTFFLYQDK